MDLVDRYLTAIRWNLPRGANADDVIAELRDVIANRIEEREDRLDRPLSAGEISGVLRDFGHPLVVAARYGTQQSLIGPDLFPFYWFSLKVVLAISLAIEVVTSVIAAVSHDDSVARAVIHAAGGAWWTLLANAGLVTLIFAVIERTGWLTQYLRDWKPESLPDLGDLRAKPRSAWETVFEIAVGIAFLLWWIGLVRVPLVYTGDKGLTMTPDPIWMALWTPILALMVARLAFNLVQLLRPNWKTLRAALAVGTAAGTIAVLAVLYRAGHWLTVASTAMPAGRVAEIDRSVNLGLRYTLLVTGAICLFQCGQELWRICTTRR